MTGTDLPSSLRSRAREQSRARYPDETGHIERDGVRVFYDVYGEGDQSVVLLPPWSIVHARHWKQQIPYLARHFRLVVIEGRGNGRSDRPRGVEHYVEREFADDILAILDRTATDSAVLIALSRGAAWASILAAERPERCRAIAYIAPAVPRPPAADGSDGGSESLLWNQDFEGFLGGFFRRMFHEPHSSKQIEDGVGWARDTDAEVLSDSYLALRPGRPLESDALHSRVQCPTLVIAGGEDRVAAPSSAAELAAQTGGTLVTIEGGGHGPHARHPIAVNRLLREFIAPPPPARRWRRANARRRRALFLCSPIGLGHAKRDVAIAQELRRLVPDLQIDWLAQDPVTRVLTAEGERVHPASRQLASESTHIESECAEHDLHAFQAIRRMDEILCANFMVFDDLVRDEPYDLWVGDEAWELDYYLHENPELKHAAYAWLTDFVGWLPIADGAEHEAALSADYNEEMIEHVARYPRVRDRAIFVGNPDDVIDESFGPGLPAIRDWTEEHFDFAGYVTGFDPSALDRERLRSEFGYRPSERVCIVTVGGSGVGATLLRRVIAAFPLARALVPDLRMIVVAGPRIDPATLPREDGLEIRAYVHDLYMHLAACDLAIVQGGLTTAMELTASKRPFLFFPLGHHFEQRLHVRHRLARYRAGRCMDFDLDGPGEIAAAIAGAIDREVDYLDVERDGASRAAALLAEVL